MFSFFKINNFERKDRDLSPNYFVSSDLFEKYKEFGYFVIRNAVEENQLNEMILLYNEVSQSRDFEVKDAFLNSGRIHSPELRNKIVGKIKDVSASILAPYVNEENCCIGNGGAFQIKPPSKNSVLNPHQDTPIVDEKRFFATYVWIPLCDTNSTNGCLSLIPKSHLWGNHQRSLNVPWRYEKNIKRLWRMMIDIPLNKGDLIFFDSALIHGSKANLSGNVRIAFTTVILPKNFQLIHYYRDANTPSDKVEVFEVDEYFFSNEDIMKRPSEKYKLLRLEDWEK